MPTATEIRKRQLRARQQRARTQMDPVQGPLQRQQEAFAQGRLTPDPGTPGAREAITRFGPPIAGTIMGAPLGPIGMMAGGAAGNIVGQEAAIAGRRARGEEVDAEPFPQRLVPAGRQGVVMGALGSGARGLAGGAENVLRSRARGGMAIPEARIAQQEEILRQRLAGVTDPRSVLTKVLTEAAKGTTGMGTTGAMAGLGFEAALPGSGVMAGMLGATGRMIINTLNRLPPTVRNLLANNPGFANWALTSMPSGVSTAAGATAGTAAGAGTALAAEHVEDLGGLMREVSPQVRSAISQFLDEMALTSREEIIRRQEEPQQAPSG